MLTQRAALLGFIAFCFYLIAVVNSLPSFFYVLMWLALGLLAASLGIAFLSLSSLDFSWNLARSTGHATPLAGHSSEREVVVPVVEATLSNRGSLNKTGILIELYLRDEVRADDLMLVFLLEAVPAGKTLDIALSLRELPRGRYRLQRARLIGSDVLGLFRARRNLILKEAETEILVAPALLPVSHFELAGRGGRARGGTRRHAKLGVGDELRGTRPYVAGDDMRQIHWKSTARTGELVMREWEQVGHAATMVIWDGAHGSEWGAPVSNSTECGLILVASLLESYATQAVPCSLALLGENAIFCPPVAGAITLRLDETTALANARATRRAPLGAALDGVWKGARDIETLTLVSASLRPDIVDFVRSLRSQNIGARVLLINGAALGRASGDPRFNARQAAQNPPLQEVENGDSISVTDAAFARQEEALVHAGAWVVSFAPQNAADIWSELQKAQIELLVPNSSHGEGTAATARDAPREM